MNLLSKICDDSVKDRDVLVDELNDEIGNGHFSASETRNIILKLIEVLKLEKDFATHESIMNLLSNTYVDSDCKAEIESYVLEYVESMKPRSLVHALSIFSESSLTEREEVLKKYSNSENASIRKIANNYLFMY